MGKCFKKEEEEEVGEKKEDGRILRVRSRGPCQIGCAFVPSPHVSCVCGAVFFTHGVWFYPTRAETPWVNPCVSCRREWPRPNSFFVQQHSFFFLLSSFFALPLSFFLFHSLCIHPLAFHTGVYMILILYRIHAGVNFPFGPLDPRPENFPTLFIFIRL